MIIKSIFLSLVLITFLFSGCSIKYETNYYNDNDKDKQEKENKLDD